MENYVLTTNLIFSPQLETNYLMSLLIASNFSFTKNHAFTQCVSVVNWFFGVEKTKTSRDFLILF